MFLSSTMHTLASFTEKGRESAPVIENCPKFILGQQPRCKSVGCKMGLTPHSHVVSYEGIPHPRILRLPASHQRRPTKPRRTDGRRASAGTFTDTDTPKTGQRRLRGRHIEGRGRARHFAPGQADINIAVMIFFSFDLVLRVLSQARPRARAIRERAARVHTRASQGPRGQAEL